MTVLIWPQHAPLPGLISIIIYYIFISYFTIGFPLTSTFGGFTGLILANSIIDIIPHDPYFPRLHELLFYLHMLD